MNAEQTPTDRMTTDLIAWLDQLRVEGRLTPEIKAQADVVHRYTVALADPGEKSEGFMKAAADAVTLLQEMASKPAHKAEVIPFKRDEG